MHMSPFHDVISLSTTLSSDTSPSSPCPTPPAHRASTLPAHALPIPTYHPPDPTKKSHAKRQPPGHVPRPRNAFILFRCDFVRQKKVPEDVENDHRNISRIVGGVWRGMGEGERRPWVEMAEREKERHGRVYPGYRYTPGSCIGKGRRRRGDVEEEEIWEIEPALLVGQGEEEERARRAKMNSKATRAKTPFKRVRPDHDESTDCSSLPSHHPTPAPRPQPEVYSHPHPPAPMSYLDLRRSSSCPPGPPRIPAVSPTRESTVPAALLIMRDDLARRPSRVTMYQSTSTSSYTSTHTSPPDVTPTCFSNMMDSPTARTPTATATSTSLSTSTSPPAPTTSSTSTNINPPPPSLAHLSHASIALYEHRTFLPSKTRVRLPIADVRPALRTGPYVLEPPRGGLGWECAPGRPVAWGEVLWGDCEGEGDGDGDGDGRNGNGKENENEKGGMVGDDFPMDISTHPSYTLTLTDALNDRRNNEINVFAPSPRRRALIPTFTNPFASSPSFNSTSATPAATASAGTQANTNYSGSGSGSGPSSGSRSKLGLGLKSGSGSDTNSPTPTPSPSPFSTPTPSPHFGPPSSGSDSTFSTPSSAFSRSTSSSRFARGRDDDDDAVHECESESESEAYVRMQTEMKKAGEAEMGTMDGPLGDFDFARMSLDEGCYPAYAGARED